MSIRGLRSLARSVTQRRAEQLPAAQAATVGPTSPADQGSTNRPPPGSAGGRVSALPVGAGPFWQGVATVARLEWRQRIRTSRWPLVLLAWVLTVYGIVALLWLSSRALPESDRGLLFYSTTTFFVLGLGLLVVPSLTATSINGDREHGTLAVLQVTLLTPTQLVLGKALAAWALVGVFLTAVVPVFVFALVSGAVELGPLLLAVLSLSVVLIGLCTLGLYFSAVTARSVTSVVLTYLTLGFLVFGTLILFATVTTLTTEEVTRQAKVWPPAGTVPGQQVSSECVIETRTTQEARTDRTWWLLALNPFVAVADVAPSQITDRTTFDPLGEISTAVRISRRGPEAMIIECGGQTDDASTSRRQAADVAPVWPVGFVFLVSLAVACLVGTARRIATPMSRLPSGTRIA